MARKKKDGKDGKDGKDIEQYDHAGKKRLNNPPVGLVSENTEPCEDIKKTYGYDPHLDPQLQWAGKAEHTSFEVPTRSLHVHERIDPKTIINAVQKEETGQVQMSIFESEKRPLREAVEFYKHKEGWSNRLIAGDSLLVMNSLLEKEGMPGKVQMIYIDPPYGIKYGSNFQPFVNKRDVTDRKDEDLTAEPEMIKAFRDTWELGIHSYLSYLKDRLLLARELLNESGSVFVQISDENVHLVRCLMDEVFGKRNFCRLITFKKTTGQASDLVASVHDYILWYSKDRSRLKSRPVLRERPSVTLEGSYTWVELPDGRTRRLNVRDREDPSSLSDCRHFMTASLVSAGASQEGSRPFEFDGVIYHPAPGTHWKTHRDGLRQLSQRGRLVAVGKTLAYKRYADDYPVVGLDCVWDDTLQSTFAVENIYVVQTTTKVIQRCILMTTDPGDLVFDPTCGSGTTAYVAEQWGRRWITCDTSRVALTLAKQRLMTANFDYYQLAHPHEGVGSGFVYKTVPHITLKSIANNEPPKEETLYDQPKVDRKKTRITGPFTAEAVPAPAVRPLEQLLVDSFQFSEKEVVDAGTKNSKLTTGNYFAATAARSGETLRQSQWRDELLKAGVRAKGGRKLEFTRIEPMSGTRWIQAEGELKTKNSQLKTLIVFGPEHAPLEQRTVENAWQEARPFKPDILLFCAFQFDDEAAKDIDELKPEIAGMQLLKVQMNADLFTDDLKKKRSGNDSFWLIGQPDVSV
ncbi:site-specific DNA-methyltransferase, partial [Thermodesulfovibrionales bacterium]|nr:site-specific DNA-methyltransferase [Thermodesulfovibrionales bacterium]